MSDTITIEKLYALLSWFIEQQQGFNSQQEAFNAKQEVFQIEQMAFNQIVLDRFQTIENRLDTLENKFDTFENRFDRFQDDQQLQHGITHRLLMQSFEHITDLQARADMRGSRDSYQGFSSTRR